MTEETIDWDEVLVTRDPDQKEVSVSFVNVDKDGSPGSEGAGDTGCPPGTFKHYSDSLLKNGGFSILTRPNTRITDVDYPTAIDADFFVYVSRSRPRPFDEFVDVSFQPRTGSLYPWTVDNLPDPVKVRIESGQTDGKAKVTMPAGSKWSESPELYPTGVVGLYYLFDIVIDSPFCDTRLITYSSPCAGQSYALPSDDPTGVRPFLLHIDSCADELPEGGGSVPSGPVPGDNPECGPHDCDALITTAGSDSIAYFIRPSTEAVIQFANGSTDVLANFEGGPSNWTVGDQAYNPISTTGGVAVDGRSSKPCATNLSAPIPRVFTGDVLLGNEDFGVYDVQAGDIRPTVRGYGTYSADASMWAYIDCTGPSAATCAFDISGGINVGVTTLNSVATDTSALSGKTEVNVSQGYLRIYGVGGPLNVPTNVVLFEAPITAASATGWYGITVTGGFTTRVSPTNSAFDLLEGQWTVGITTPVGSTTAVHNIVLSGIQTTASIYRDANAGTGFNTLIVNNNGGDPAIYGICNGRPSSGFERHLVDYIPPTYCERIP